MVLLYCAFSFYLRQHPPYSHPDQPPCFPNLHPLPLHATSPSTPRVRLPRLSAPRQCNLNLDERRLCKFARCNAVHAFRLRICDRLHHDISRWHIPSETGKGGDKKGNLGETVLLLARDWVSQHDLGDHRGNGESLLAGCFDDDGGGLCGLFLQLHIIGALAGGGSAAVVFETGEADSQYWRAVSTERRKDIGKCAFTITMRAYGVVNRLPPQALVGVCTYWRPIASS